MSRIAGKYAAVLRDVKSNAMNIQTPDWVKNAIFYQLFPDRFARSPRV